jgi:zinc/manganese transport system substrate-binding protein
MFALMLAFASSAAQAGQSVPITLVAAENFYADVAAQIGGATVSVQSILSSPAQDPHLFEVTPSAARAITGARIVIYNGIDYDPWMSKLLAAAPVPGQQRIEVARLLGRKPGDNPHLWYNPKTMPLLARSLAGSLIGLDPAQRSSYEQRLARFDASIQPIEERIAALRTRLAGTAVAATEPVLNELLDALGLVVKERAFQTAVMNNTEPTATQLARFEIDLARRQVQLLIYNEQSGGPLVEHMRALAQKNHIPVLGVTETEPEGLHYQQWLLSVLTAIDQALSAVKGPA